jgi:hypothetical protein
MTCPTCQTGCTAPGTATKTLEVQTRRSRSLAAHLLVASRSEDADRIARQASNLGIVSTCFIQPSWLTRRVQMTTPRVDLGEPLDCIDTEHPPLDVSQPAMANEPTPVSPSVTGGFNVTQIRSSWPSGHRYRTSRIAIGSRLT